ncbi:MAG: ATP-binding protein [Bacteroidales bacterium]|jgi:serine/threonine-protein kinase RsbT|nr:ATP-binding protein [Bacteroidales bacterium]
MHLEYNIQGGDFSSAGTASSAIKKVLKQLMSNQKIIRKVVVALYEAEVNIVAHAFSGEITVDINVNEIVINVKDKGPGISDIEKAMENGYSTASDEVREMGFGAGMGLANIKNNTSKFEIKSQVGIGTELLIIVNLK